MVNSMPTFTFSSGDYLKDRTLTIHLTKNHFSTLSACGLILRPQISTRMKVGRCTVYVIVTLISVAACP